MSNVLLGKHTLPLKNQREIKIDLNLRTSIENITSNTMIETKRQRRERESIGRPTRRRTEETVVFTPSAPFHLSLIMSASNVRPRTCQAS